MLQSTAQGAGTSSPPDRTLSWPRAQLALLRKLLGTDVSSGQPIAKGNGLPDHAGIVKMNKVVGVHGVHA
jgi:hypothetical protein